MDIEFKGQYEKQQYFKAISLAGRPSKRGLILRVLIFAGFTGVFIWLVVTTVLDIGSSGLDIPRVFRHMITALILAYFIFRPYVNIYLTANKLWNDPITRREISGIVSNQGVSYEAAEVKWDEYAIKRLTADMVVLVTADRRMTFLPRNFFNSDGDWNRFTQLVELHIVEAK